MYVPFLKEADTARLVYDLTFLLVFDNVLGDLIPGCPY